MKLYASIRNERGGKKSTSDDTRIRVELSYGNRVIGEVSFYPIREGRTDLGYRVLWSDELNYEREVIAEEMTGKS